MEKNYKHTPRMLLRHRYQLYRRKEALQYNYITIFIDINECIVGPGTLCKHNCENIAGGYKCTCSEGFSIASDNISCEGIHVMNYIHSTHKFAIIFSLI